MDQEVLVVNAEIEVYKENLANQVVPLTVLQVTLVTVVTLVNAELEVRKVINLHLLHKDQSVIKENKASKELEANQVCKDDKENLA